MTIFIHHILILALAVYEAYGDHGQIKRHEKIDHSSQWWFRVGTALTITFLTTHWIWRNGGDPWVFGPLALSCWPLFSLPFRVTLNKLRGLNWWYMGRPLGVRTDEDAWYDNLLHGLAAGVSNSGNALGQGRPYYPERLPAILATALELTVFAIAHVWMAKL